MKTDLPIHKVLDELADALASHDAVVLEAPPGAGKTTVVPLALRDTEWLGEQRIVMLEPRRMAARAAAEYMASTLGEKAGETVGYRVRLDTKVSKQTRVEVITEGILTRRLQNDPGLEGVGLLIFDEFHERSLDSDLGLALALQGRELFREGPPLKMLVMSATLDGARVSELLGGAPVVSSQGRMFPVEVHYGAKAEPRRNIVEPVVRTINDVLANPETGNVLVFLPGQGEIRRVEEALVQESSEAVRRSDTVVSALYGGLSLEDQRRAIEPPSEGVRKVVLATNIAETSLTIEGITTVIDSGLAREPVYDPNTGMTRLTTKRISQDNATQRMGRAGRLGPGHCYRLWSEGQQNEMSARATPEILQADLTPLALQLLAWGVDDPVELNWLDSPPTGPWNQALDLLRSFGAVEGVSLTADGEQMAKLPVHPRLAHMLLLGHRWGVGELACDVAAQLSEGDTRRQHGADILRQLDKLSGKVKQQAKQYRRICSDLTPSEGTPHPPRVSAPSEGVGLLIAAAYPDRIGRRRQAKGNVYQLANGRSAVLDDTDALCQQEWIAVAESGGRAGFAEDMVYSAAALDIDAVQKCLPELIVESERVEWDEKAGKFVAETQSRIGSIVIARKAHADIPTETRSTLLLDVVREKGLQLLNWAENVESWRARVQLVTQTLRGSSQGEAGSPQGEAWPDLSDEALLADLSWLEPYLADVRSLKDFKKLDLKNILLTLLPWPLPKELDELAPERIEVPSGSNIRIDYTQSPPVLAVKLQEMFGAEATPTIVQGRVPLMIHLLSPAQRPLQVTQDLASFWRNGYEGVKKEMKGRYPKHPWPDNPLTAVATGATKRRLQD